MTTKQGLTEEGVIQVLTVNDKIEKMLQDSAEGIYDIIENYEDSMLLYGIYHELIKLNAKTKDNNISQVMHIPWTGEERDITT